MKQTPTIEWNAPQDLVESWAHARSAAHSAGEIIRRYWNQSFTIRHKGEVDLVSEVDLAAEEAIVTQLLSAYPQDGIIAEERGAEGAQGGRVWHIDPLDGTTNFSHGFPHFSVSIAAVVDGEAQVAVVYAPLRNWWFSAIRGAGAYWNDDPMTVSETQEVGQSLLASGFPYDRKTAKDNNFDRFTALLRQSRGVRRSGSAALDLAFLANGWLDGYWEIRLNSWDVQGGWLLVKEAGGTVSALAASEGPPTPEDFVASNGRIHQELIHELRRASTSVHGETRP